MSSGVAAETFRTQPSGASEPFRTTIPEPAFWNGFDAGVITSASQDSAVAIFSLTDFPETVM